MTLRAAGLYAFLAFAGALNACAGDAADAPRAPAPILAPAPRSTAASPVCTPGGDGSYTSALYDDLDRYCMVEIRDGDISPRWSTVMSYELSTPSFSDYAIKRRTVWMPPGTAAKYSATDVFEFPAGTVFTKSFGFPQEPARSNGPIRWVETRVLVRGDAGWTGVSYLWNEEQTAARKAPGGTVRVLDVRATDGSVQHASYLVPSMQQCPKCHGRDASFVPIGPHADALSADQIAHWTRARILDGAPTTPTADSPAWNDPSAPVDVRARLYLAANCSYCHSAKGEARTTGLFLTFEETDPARLGRCKAPVAAGAATANLRFDVVPGMPDASILLHRMVATEPSIAMPEIGRSVVHTEGVELVRSWIAGMSGDCALK